MGEFTNNEFRDLTSEAGCGCRPEDDELCAVGKRLVNRAADLVPPYGDDDPHSWRVFDRANREMNRHFFKARRAK